MQLKIPTTNIQTTYCYSMNKSVILHGYHIRTMPRKMNLGCGSVKNNETSNDCDDDI